MGDTTRMMKDGQAYDIPNDKVQGASKMGFHAQLDPAPNPLMRAGSEFGLGLASGATGSPETTSGSDNIMQMLKGAWGMLQPPQGTGEKVAAGITGPAFPAYRMGKGIVEQGGQFLKEGWKGQYGFAKSALKGDTQAMGDAAAETMHGTGGMIGTLLGLGVGETEATRFSEGIGKIKGGSMADVFKELEQYRKTANTTNPSKGQRFMAEKAHAALTERINHEWNDVYSKLQTTPTDAISIKEALTPLAKVDPVIQKWIETYMPETENSIQMPMWDKLRELSKDMNKDLTKPNVDRTIKAEITSAHGKLEGILKKAADEQGLGKQYQRAYQLNRKMQNVKKYTALEGSAVKPNPLWQLGGTVLGAMSGGRLGVSSEIGGAFMGKSIAGEVGKGVTGKGKYSVPDLSLRGEKGIWEELGEKPPKGTDKNIRKGGDIIHWEPPKESGGKPPSSADPKGGPKGDGPKGGGPESGRDRATRRGGGGQSAGQTRIQALNDSIKNAQAKYENAKTTGDKMRAVKDLSRFNEQLLKEFGEISQTTDEKAAAADLAKKATDFSTRNKARAGEAPKKPAASDHSHTKAGANLDTKAYAEAKKRLGPDAKSQDVTDLALKLAKEMKASGEMF